MIARLAEETDRKIAAIKRMSMVGLEAADSFWVQIWPAQFQPVSPSLPLPFPAPQGIA